MLQERAEPGRRCPTRLETPSDHRSARYVAGVADRRDRALTDFVELVDRAKAVGRLREDFVPEDVPMFLMANAGVLTATADAAPGTWRRLVGCLLEACAARPGGTITTDRMPDTRAPEPTNDDHRRTVWVAGRNAWATPSGSAHPPSPELNIGTNAMTDPVSQQPVQPPELPDRDTAVGNWILDPTQSQVTFAIKHFWGAITVRGSFDQVSGEAVVAADGTITGHLSIDTASVDTKNKKRDEHLRSPDFFHVEQHPHLTVTVTSAEPADPAALTCRGTLEAAGHATPIVFTAHVEDSSPDMITLRADLTVDRTDHAMTWNPLGMTAKVATATATVHFARS